mmetsp:Transcript_37908/g.77356  ORF Transcript_37908/g.77356 Transcript_37908/m.77356 type:complete len:211 (-) Transcript_37908:252-884(-)|eukprot:CAMPEP_0183295562 /NCGR_PEP_ID=MMETSP0160_2-20130417/3480_1 /TAXON_ID=2839 ORGANISM="Odontella Sinensis, Strain Grunow 1884" /NCGR_SAMPLE_ID=MMETSP0160_2 /ASSEMBLY_ACC=CAM_ASM_000250 /LENGTH=210 /DNA_ID=CAMNT_0025457067 /DNA_START=115 /DNA_END=747 /DNA_ORIENTATION=+
MALNITGCWELELPRPIWNQSTWDFLQNTYRDSVEEEWSSIPPGPEDSFQVPYEVRQSNGKGRGIYAREKVNKGQLVWLPTETAIFFADQEEEFRYFLSELPYDLACDVIQWAYVFQEEDDVFACGVDLGNGSFMNHGKAKDDMNVVSREDGGMVASRDIEVGEEILADYTSFHEIGQLSWFDYLAKEAWDCPGSGTNPNSVLFYLEEDL